MTTSTRSGDVAEVKLRYAAAADPITDDENFRLHLPTDAIRYSISCGSCVTVVVIGN